MWKRPFRQKPRPFSDVEIDTKAYELWQARNGAGGSSEQDWQQAIAELEVERSPVKRLERWTRSNVQGFWNWTGLKEKKGWDLAQLLIGISIPLAVFSKCDRPLMVGGVKYHQAIAH